MLFPSLITTQLYVFSLLKYMAVESKDKVLERDWILLDKCLALAQTDTRKGSDDAGALSQQIAAELKPTALSYVDNLSSNF